MRKRGFTLIELSIVLVIIGLLVGGVLKGKGMIDNAKMKRVKSDIDGVMAAVYSYQDKFGYMPGDDPTNKASVTSADCSGGNANGLFDDGDEIKCAWQEMIEAGFIGGDPTDHTGGAAKKSPYGGGYDFNVSAGNKNYISIANVPPSAAASLDTKYDDGVWNKGDVQGDADYNTTTTKISWYAF